MVELGKTVRDLITGFTGISTGRVIYITGCNRILVSPPVDNNGKIMEAEWVDEQRIEILEGNKIIVLSNTGTTGYDIDPPKR